MAISKLSLYNNALMLVGERPLVTDTDNVETRRQLDIAYDQNAVDFCLEMVRPVFALVTITATADATVSNSSLTNQFNLPADNIAIHSVFADQDMDSPVERFINENNKLFAEISTLTYRYTSNAVAIADWSASFANVVSAYLAKEISPRFAPQKLKENTELFSARADATMKVEMAKAPMIRPKSSTFTIDANWQKVYNSALLMLGLEQITSLTDDSDRRTKLDAAVQTGVVAQVLEDLGWTFGVTSVQLTYNPSLEPDWGYTRVFDKPTNIHRIDGIFHDDRFTTPIRHYEEEEDYWFCDVDTIYVKYVSEEYLTNPVNWPQYFKNLIASELALLAGPSIQGANVENAMRMHDKRRREAESTDAMRGPPQTLPRGSWVRSRANPSRRNSYTGRP